MYVQAFLVEPTVEGMEPEMVGNRTECALLLMLRSCGVGYAPLRDAAAIEAVGTFTAQRKMSSVLLRLPEGATTELYSGLQHHQPHRLHVKVRCPPPRWSSPSSSRSSTTNMPFQQKCFLSNKISLFSLLNETTGNDLLDA